MASISKDKNGTKRIVFFDGDGKRHFIRLGKVDMKMMETIKTHIEKLAAAQIMKVSPDADTARWVAALPDDFHAKLAKTGIVATRKKVGTLGEQVPAFIKSRAATVSKQTIEVWGQSEESLYRFFGKDRKVDTITKADAESFRSWLVSSGRFDGKGGLAPTTVWKRLQHVVAFFKWMVENDDIAKSPFNGMSMNPVTDEERNDYIETDFIYKVMKVAPDAEWKLIIALWRFAGLRGSSEPLLLRWKDIKWDKETIVIHSKKTKRYEGKATREIPLFPELIEPLKAARQEAGEDDVYVITKHAPRYLKKVADRSKLDLVKANLGSIFAKFVKKAGITPWSKIINNVRASWITDLLDGKYQTSDQPFGIHVIAEWAGNSPKVILRYYSRVRKQVYTQVTQFNKQIRAGTPIENFFKRETPADTVSNAFSGVAQKASQYTAARGGIGQNGVLSEPQQDLLKLFVSRYLEARNGKEGNLTETPYFTATERTGLHAVLISL